MSSGLECTRERWVWKELWTLGQPHCTFSALAQNYLGNGALYVICHPWKSISVSMIAIRTNPLRVCTQNMSLSFVFTLWKIAYLCIGYAIARDDGQLGAIYDHCSMNIHWWVEVPSQTSLLISTKILKGTYLTSRFCQPFSLKSAFLGDFVPFFVQNSCTKSWMLLKPSADKQNNSDHEMKNDIRWFSAGESEVLLKSYIFKPHCREIACDILLITVHTWTVCRPGSLTVW